VDARRIPATALVLLLVLATTLTACGAPRRVRTHNGDPDLAGSDATISHRLRNQCSAFASDVAVAFPGVSLELTDGQCEWIDTPKAAPAGGVGQPLLIVGILAKSDGSTALDQTTAVLSHERPITLPGTLPGRRAVFDPETRTLYVLEHGRLWYLQRVGSGAGGTDERFLSRLGSSLGAI
jgi:hypothetical protein